MRPTTINTNERIFKIVTFDGDTFLCNLKDAQRELKEGNIKDLFHLWNYEFKRFGKIELKNM